MPTYECPTCRNTTSVDRAEDAPHRPFCCQRCKLVDLGRWLDESYVVSESVDPEEIDIEELE